ncbi:MAG: acyl-CoA dehydrogenase family protein [Chloroflexota bacterium]
MLDFRVDEEQKMLIDAINRFSTERVREQFRDAEEEGHLPPELVQAGWEIGWLQTAVPEQYGGFGEYSAVTGVLALEEYAYGDLATTFKIMSPNSIAIPLMLCGTEAQKEQYLPHFVGESIPKLSSALMERVYQFNPHHLATTAVSTADGFVLNGRKVYVPAAKEADTILVWANENGQTEGFLIDTGIEGISVGAKDKLMGIKSLPTYELILNDIKIPPSAKLGGEVGCDFDLLLNHSRVAASATAVGMARAAVEYAIAYAKQREQFGRPVAQNQSIAFLLADMMSDVESMRMMVWEAAWLIDQGQEITKEALLMKHFVDQAVVRVTDGAVQVLGGYGYIREYPVELWLRNARGFATFDGMVTI